MIIYKTTNNITGKIYIGQSIYNDPTYIGSGVYLTRSIKKHGRENFSKELLEHCDSREHLCEREKYWIKFYNSRDNSIGYNITAGGEWGDAMSTHPDKVEIYRKISITKNIVGEDGLSSAKRAGIKSSKTKTETIQENGKSIAENIGIKGRETKSKMQHSGLSIYQEIGQKVSKSMNMIDDQGKTRAHYVGIKASHTKKTTFVDDNETLTIHQRALHRLSKTLLTADIETNQTLAKTASDKSVLRKYSTIDEYGYNIHQISSRKANITMQSTVMSNGLTIREHATNKMHVTKMKIGHDGLTTYTRTSQASANTRKTYVRQNGLTIQENTNIKLSKTLNTVLSSGLTIAEEQGRRKRRTHLLKCLLKYPETFTQIICFNRKLKISYITTIYEEYGPMHSFAYKSYLSIIKNIQPKPMKLQSTIDTSCSLFDALHKICLKFEITHDDLMSSENPIILDYLSYISNTYC